MFVLLAGALWSALVVYLLSRALRQFRAFRGAALSTVQSSADLPAVSIIVPVRNEVANIGLCLEGLRMQTCLSDRSGIIVVDDDSQDGTAMAAASFAEVDPRISLADAGVLPEGWVGKPHACWRGALLADGDWLCFIDADVRAAPELVAAALKAAEAQRIDMLSLQPLQELGSFWERLVMPAGLLVLACAKRFQPCSEEVANGQFLLIRPEVYFQVGGHAAVRAEICEDKALALRVRTAGFKFRVLSAENLARTRMYRDRHSLWEGLSKNTTEVLGGVSATLAAAAAAFLFGWVALLLPVAAIYAAFGEPSLEVVIGSILALLGSGIVIGVQFGAARHFRVPAVFSLMFALGYTAVACLACNGVLANLNGRVTWKGRTYQLAKPSPERL